MKSGLIYTPQRIPVYLSTLPHTTRTENPYQKCLSDVVSNSNLPQFNENQNKINTQTNHEENSNKISVVEAEQQYKMLIGNILGGNESERKKKLLHLMEEKQKQSELIKAGLIEEEEELNFQSQEDRDLIFSFKPKEYLENKATFQKNNFAKLTSIASNKELINSIHIKDPKQKKMKRANTSQCNQFQFEKKNRISIDSVLNYKFCFKKLQQAAAKVYQSKKKQQIIEDEEINKVDESNIKRQTGEDYYIHEKLQTLAESKDNQKQISEEEIDSLFGIHIFNGQTLLKMLQALAEINENSLKRSIQQKIKEQQLFYKQSLFNQEKINLILKDHESSLRNQEKEFKIIKRLFVQNPEEVTNYLKTLYKLKVKKGKISQLMEADFQKINYYIVSEVYPKFINLMD